MYWGGAHCLCVCFSLSRSPRWLPRIHTYTHTYINPHINACTNIRTSTHTHTHTHTYIDEYIDCCYLALLVSLFYFSLMSLLSLFSSLSSLLALHTALEGLSCVWRGGCFYICQGPLPLHYSLDHLWIDKWSLID